MMPEWSSPSASSAADISMPREATPRIVERQEPVVLEPAQIGFVEGAEIGDAVFQHRHPLDSHPEGKALIFLGIDAAIAQYLRVNHAAAEDLQPIAAGADLQLAALARA